MPRQLLRGLANRSAWRHQANQFGGVVALYQLQRFTEIGVVGDHDRTVISVKPGVIQKMKRQIYV